MSVLPECMYMHHICVSDTLRGQMWAMNFCELFASTLWVLVQVTPHLRLRPSLSCPHLRLRPGLPPLTQLVSPQAAPYLLSSHFCCSVEFVLPEQSHPFPGVFILPHFCPCKPSFSKFLANCTPLRSHRYPCLLPSLLLAPSFSFSFLSPSLSVLPLLY